MRVRVMAVGDILLQTRDGAQSPFVFVEEVLNKADIVFGNLEVPITRVDHASFEKSVSLKTSPENLSFLKEANFSVVNLAHNHICDYGATGAVETLRHLEKGSISYIGVGRSLDECLKAVAFTVNGITIAFVGFYAGGGGLSSDDFYIAGMDQQLVLQRIGELKDQYDFVIVSFHGGIENVFYPSPERQILFRACVDAGASVILGHHPHMLQGIEEYHSGLIFYSLGNFNFWQFDVEPNYYHRLSTIAEISLEDGQVTYKCHPVKIDDNYCPTPITNDEELSRFQIRVEDISNRTARGIEKWWWFGEIAEPYLAGIVRNSFIRIRRYGPRHLVQFCRWLVSPFVIKCYLGIIRSWISRDRISV